MKIVHFSDWHGRSVDLPKADLYICTGDMLPNFLDGDEARNQARWLKNHTIELDAPVVCVRGNHDFIALAPLFKAPEVIELQFGGHQDLHEVLGLSVTGHRGVPFINGGWSDEIDRVDLYLRLREMPTADLYLTHYPPAGILDYCGPGGGHIGLVGMANELIYRREQKSWHFFGHVHECGGQVYDTDVVAFSNAACTYNALYV